MSKNIKNKKKLGQFYTTNYDYIFSGFYIPKNVKNIIEPFVGNGDLLNFIKDQNRFNIECYDIDPKIENKNIQIKNTLLEPPDYNNKFIITNPPYLARNKNIEKDIYNKYGYNDLYKCFLASILKNNVLRGILIVPLNFISSIRENDIKLKKLFLEKYSIIRLNIFEEKVFNDTSYSVCSFQFRKKNNHRGKIKCVIFPKNHTLYFTLSEKNNYIIGGHIYKLSMSKKYTVERATKNTKNTKNKECITNIFLKCIDDNINSRICLKIVKDSEKYIDNTNNLSARSYASLVISPKITLKEQKELVNKFNNYLDNYRKKYNSLFLTNYRESNSIARKRISFSLAFDICRYLLR